QNRETYHDGNFMEGLKLFGPFSMAINTIPLYHHSFKLWSGFAEWGLRDVSRNAFNRCLYQCKFDSQRQIGKTSQFSEPYLNKCAGDCTSWNDFAEQTIQV